LSQGIDSWIFLQLIDCKASILSGLIRKVMRRLCAFEKLANNFGHQLWAVLAICAPFFLLFLFFRSKNFLNGLFSLSLGKLVAEIFIQIFAINLICRVRA